MIYIIILQFIAISVATAYLSGAVKRLAALKAENEELNRQLDLERKQYYEAICAWSKSTNVLHRMVRIVKALRNDLSRPKRSTRLSLGAHNDISIIDAELAKYYDLMTPKNKENATP